VTPELHLKHLSTPVTPQLQVEHPSTRRAPKETWKTLEWMGYLHYRWGTSRDLSMHLGHLTTLNGQRTIVAGSIPEDN
jgi:hypothetical protein